MHWRNTINLLKQTYSHQFCLNILFLKPFFLQILIAIIRPGKYSARKGFCNIATVRLLKPSSHYKARKIVCNDKERFQNIAVAFEDIAIRPGKYSVAKPLKYFHHKTRLAVPITKAISIDGLVQKQVDAFSFLARYCSAFAVLI